MSSGIRFHRVATSCGYSTLTFIRLLPAVLIPAYRGNAYLLII